MRTAITIPDELFRRAERLARNLKVSRSQLYTTALVRLLEADPKEDVTLAYDSAFDDGGADDRAAAAGSVLETIDWSDR